MSSKVQVEPDRIVKTVSFPAVADCSLGTPEDAQFTAVVSSELTTSWFMTLEPEPAGVAPAGWPVKGIHESTPGCYRPACFINRAPSTTGDDFTEIAYYPLGFSYTLPSKSFRHFGLDQ